MGWLADREFNDDFNETIEEQRIEGRATVIAARRQHIRDTARCRDCGATAKACRENNTGDQEGPGTLCCWSGRHVHDEDKRAITALLDEVEAGGHIRTVAEVDSPPVLGPRPITMTWLLEQDTWWYPHRRPAVRVAEMDKPWRFNTARFLERRAAALASAEEWSALLFVAAFGAPDDIDLTIGDPLKWLHEQPLLRALRRGLPDGGRKLRLLEARAVHWNTCPMRLAHPARTDHCLCLRSGGRVVGATNDPATTTAIVRAAEPEFRNSGKAPTT